MILVDSSAWVEVRDLVSRRFVTTGTLGVTVPATDLIIASSARLADAELLHFDGHFELIAEHLPLVTLGPLEPPAREASDEAHTSQSDARGVGQDRQDGPSAGGSVVGSAQ